MTSLVVAPVCAVIVAARCRRSWSRTRPRSTSVLASCQALDQTVARTGRPCQLVNTSASRSSATCSAYAPGVAGQDSSEQRQINLVLRQLSEWRDIDKPMVEAISDTLAGITRLDSQEQACRVLDTVIEVLERSCQPTDTEPWYAVRCDFFHTPDLVGRALYEEPFKAPQQLLPESSHTPNTGFIAY